MPERTPAIEKVTKNQEHKDQNVTENRECSKSLLCERERKNSKEEKGREEKRRRGPVLGCCDQLLLLLPPPPNSECTEENL